VALALSLLGGAAAAHDLGLSQSEVKVRGKEVDVHLVLAARELGRLVDADGDGVVTEGEVASARTTVEARLVARTAVSVDGKPCTPGAPRAAVDAKDGIAVDVTYACPEAPGELAVRYDWLGDVTPGHKHVATVIGGTKTLQALLDAEHRGTSLSLPRRAEPPASSAPPWVRWLVVAAIGAAAGVVLGIRRLRSAGAPSRDPKQADRR
jgi:hypothetical protein